MHTLLLTPSDILYFGDGRPVSGSLAGHGANFPQPHILNTALHAALHNNPALEKLKTDAHLHRRKFRDANGQWQYSPSDPESRKNDGHKFGSLKTAGPFPVLVSTKDNAGAGAWHFPTPLDLVKTGAGTGAIGFTPVKTGTGSSSLPAPLTHALAATQPPSKDNKPGDFLPAVEYANYIDGKNVAAGLRTTDFADAEHYTGIGIDPEKQTQDGTRIYSAKYLRLHENWRLGLCADATDKGNGTGEKLDLIAKFLGAGTAEIVLGGQQRLCKIAEPGARAIPLPRGKTTFTAGAGGKHRVKWVLLSPAIFPAGTGAGKTHPGGFLPNWVCEKTGAVLLPDNSKKAELEAANPRQRNEERNDYRKRIQKLLPQIHARLVAALTGKPQTVTGWNLKTGAPDATQLAVPAGSIYYFECDTAGAARALADALNWHGTGTEIVNRRSTLLGEKGCGIGLCAEWRPATNSTQQ